jgi:hypothetical protein
MAMPSARGAAGARTDRERRAAPRQARQRPGVRAIAGAPRVRRPPTSSAVTARRAGRSPPRAGAEDRAPRLESRAGASPGQAPRGGPRGLLGENTSTRSRSPACRLDAVDDDRRGARRLGGAPEGRDEQREQQGAAPRGPRASRRSPAVRVTRCVSSSPNTGSEIHRFGRNAHAVTSEMGPSPTWTRSSTSRPAIASNPKPTAPP